MGVEDGGGHRVRGIGEDYVAGDNLGRPVSGDGAACGQTVIAYDSSQPDSNPTQRAQHDLVKDGIVGRSVCACGDQSNANKAGARGRGAMVSHLQPVGGGDDRSGVERGIDVQVGGIAVLDDDPGDVGRRFVF